MSRRLCLLLCAQQDKDSKVIVNATGLLWYGCFRIFFEETNLFRRFEGVWLNKMRESLNRASMLGFSMSPFQYSVRNHSNFCGITPVRCVLVVRVQSSHDHLGRTQRFVCIPSTVRPFFVLRKRTSSPTVCFLSLLCSKQYDMHRRFISNRKVTGVQLLRSGMCYNWLVFCQRLW
jgi:hypothetical protein